MTLHLIVARSLLIGRPPVVLSLLASVASGTTTSLLGVIGRLLARLLGTTVELVANSKIVLASINNLLKSVVVTVNLDCVSYDCLDAIVVAHYFD